MDTVEEIGGLRVPDLADINATRAAIRPFIRRTPIFERDDLPGLPGTFQFKFELLQVAGTFKARGAFSSLLALDAPARAAGVTAISSGNHAVAVAYAAMRVGMSAKVVMVRTANPVRVAAARRFGAEVVLAEDAPAGFAIVREIEREEGRFFVHPFNSYRTILGTATLGAEWSEQACSTATGGLDAVIMAIGGGGTRGRGRGGIQASYARYCHLWGGARGVGCDASEFRRGRARKNGSHADHRGQPKRPAHGGLQLWPVPAQPG